MEEIIKEDEVVITQPTQKEYREERFEFLLFVNNNLICKRNFKINNYINDSMQSLDFKKKVDEIVDMIDNDLKSKSRVYTWYYFDENHPEDFNEEMLKPWDCTFKFVVTDNKVPVIEKIWDGYGYPRAIREKVDITNKTVKVTTYDGKTYSYDKESYFEQNKDRLTPDMYVLRAMIMDKPDLLFLITKKICEVCSPSGNVYQTISDYTLNDVYKTREYERLADGSFKKDKNGKYIPLSGVTDRKKYYNLLDVSKSKYISAWSKIVKEKTNEYFTY